MYQTDSISMGYRQTCKACNWTLAFWRHGERLEMVMEMGMRWWWWEVRVEELSGMWLGAENPEPQ